MGSDRSGQPPENTYTIVPASTLQHRDRGRGSIQQQAIQQQHLLRMSRDGYQLPVETTRNLAYMIMLQRASGFQILTPDHKDLHPSEKS